MKRLNSYLEDLQKKNPVNPTHLMFYLKNGSEQAEGKPNSVHVVKKGYMYISGHDKSAADSPGLVE